MSSTLRKFALAHRLTNTARGAPGQLCNHIFRNVAAHFFARAFNLMFDYGEYAPEIAALGILLYVGSIRAYTRTIQLHDDNFFQYLRDAPTRIPYNIVIRDCYCQTPEFSAFLYAYFRKTIRNNIVTSNPYRDRYDSNNDVFVHVRLTDAEHVSPGLAYYESVLSSLTYENGYISSDDLNHPTCQTLIARFGLRPHVNTAVDTIQFGSTCKHIVLSNGTFSWMIGAFGFYSHVTYPTVQTQWHGDLYSGISDWTPHQSNAS